MELKGKIGLVSGAAIGLGRMVAERLSSRGVRTALLDIDREGLQQTLEEIRTGGGDAHIFTLDLLDAAEIERVINEIEDMWGRVDIVANIAGLWHDHERTYIGKLLHEIPIEEIDALIGVNMRAPILVSRACIPGMIKQKRGKILNISGSFPEGGYAQVHYYVSKKGVENFTQAVAPELRKHSIQINCISPGDFDSEWFQTLVPEYLYTSIGIEDVTQLALFLLENPAADQITGQIIGIGDHWTQWDVGQFE